MINIPNQLQNSIFPLSIEHELEHSIMAYFFGQHCNDRKRCCYPQPPRDWSNQLRQNNKSLEKTSHQNIYIYYLTIDMQQSLVSKERISEVLGKKEYKKKEVLGVCLFLSQSISIPCLCMFLLIKCNIGLR